MPLQIIGLTTNVADVDANNQLRVGLTRTLNQSGFAALVSEVDPGTFTGARYVLPSEVDDDYRLRVASDSLMFFEPWAGTTLNSGQWSSTVTTMTTAVSGSYLRLNNGLSAASAAVARVSSYRTFANYTSFLLYCDFSLQVQAANWGVPGTTWEVGLYLATGTAAPTDGVFLRMNALGELRLGCSFGGSESLSSPINYSGLSTFTDYDVLISVETRELELWIDDVLYATIDRPTGAPDFTQSLALPFEARIYNATTPAPLPASATALLIGPVTVSSGGMRNALEFPDRVAMSGQGGYQTQSGFGTYAQTANWVNNTVPTSAVLLNAAAEYATLGGLFLFTLAAGAETDWLVFAYQIPTDAVGSMNRNLLIRGVRIDTVTTAAAIATTPTVLQWGMAVGATAVTLATAADTATGKAPRRVPIGTQSFVVGAPIGTQGVSLSETFNSPLLGEPGSFVQVFVRAPLNTVSGQIFRGTCFIDAQFE